MKSFIERETYQTIKLDDIQIISSSIAFSIPSKHNCPVHVHWNHDKVGAGRWNVSIAGWSCPLPWDKKTDKGKFLTSILLALCSWLCSIH